MHHFLSLNFMHSMLLVFMSANLILSSRFCNGAGWTKVPAVYLFGDSLADVGNNNEWLSIIKANFRHNGIDFLNSEATGRFSNGKNGADFLAAKLGLPTSPPYLSVFRSNDTSSYLTGINFASGGSGILDSTHKDGCISFNKQIEFFATMYSELVENLGSPPVQLHLSKSLFAFVTGSNDIMAYVNKHSSSSTELDKQFVNSMLLLLRQQLKKLYNLGARKFAFLGTAPIGCAPRQRSRTEDGSCNEQANYLSVQFNKGVASLLHKMKLQCADMSYSFFDTYPVMLDYIKRPNVYGFKEVEAACCGFGHLRATIPCIPIALYCNNRTNHLFWDFYHPTERTSEMLVSAAFDGSSPYVHPMNIRQLAAM